MLNQEPFHSCLLKQHKIVAIFSSLGSLEEKYEKIMALGKKSPRMDKKFRLPQNQITGCQSVMYLHSYLEEGKLYFEVDSEALISLGLATLLIDVYQGESPETVLKCFPEYLEEIGIKAALTPGRANGLYSIHLKMKQDALNAIMQPQLFVKS